MNFRRKQFLASGITLVLTLALLVVVLVLLGSINRNTSEIVGDRYLKVKTLSDFRQAFSVIHSELGYMTTDGSNLNDRLNTIETNRQLSVNLLQTLEQMTFSADGKALFARIRTGYNDYLALVKRITDAAQAGKTADASTLYVTDAKQLREGLTVTMNDFKTLQENLMNEAQERSKQVYGSILAIVGLTAFLTLAAGAMLSIWVIRDTGKRLGSITAVLGAVDLGQERLPRLAVTSRDEFGQISASFNEMAASLESHQQQVRAYNRIVEEQNWVQTRIAEVAVMFQGATDLAAMSRSFLSAVAAMIGAMHGAVYLRRTDGNEEKLVRVASFAAIGQAESWPVFRLGEGLVGQCALEKRTFSLLNVPEPYIRIVSGLGEASPRNVLIVPVEFEGKVTGVIEYASFEPFTPPQLTLVDQIRLLFGIALDSVGGRMEIERLLQESQALTEELQVQAEELQTQAEELQTQTEELQTQQEELSVTNEKLEEQNRYAEQKNHELELASREMEKYAEQLRLSSRYKTEFLTNMSHELRTPLNSMLILSQLLADNEQLKLAPEEQEYARVIHQSGQDLLSLINDVLDLSKVEAGKLEVIVDEVNTTEIPALMRHSFDKLAEAKRLRFDIALDDRVPPTFRTDGQRLLQIVRNLLSNAFKFTEQGSVQLRIGLAKTDEYDGAARDSGEPVSARQRTMLAISVADTGIGIPEDKQQLIFEAFQQLDGTISRKYGGTGLGLSICRELARLLGGSLSVTSVQGRGSTFTLYVPESVDGSAALPAAPLETAAALARAETIEVPAIQAVAPAADRDADDRSHDAALFAGKRILLVDDDARNLYALTAALENEGFLVTAAGNGKQCLDLLAQVGADLVLMDIMMPIMDGYEAMRAIRANPEWAELPIITLTAKAMKQDRDKCLEAGASDYISKPVRIDQLFSLMRVWLTK
ncbi:response regulator [Paenibacillus cymbidii]|uniref:response regulator n=1 Tax=Paenibacillus cymbidii TaxID=1639034 RepID=UPI00108025AA|nr:response regulator [Paenibacillus cymbidii]